VASDRHHPYLEPIMDFHLPAGDSGPILYATTADGLRLPVIDVTHPVFAVEDDPVNLAARREAFLASDRGNGRLPRFVTRLIVRLAARRSRLLRRIVQASRDRYLDSITTYKLKLGAERLPPGFDSPMDGRVAAAPRAELIRLRMQQIARLLAEGLQAALAEAPDAPLHLVNIAGGPALDSINTVIILARANVRLLHRPIVIHVLDAHQDGPDFGARALLALTASEGPLHGLDVQLQRHGYDWNDTAPLVALLAGRTAPSSPHRRRAACSTTAPTMRSSPTSPRSRRRGCRLSPARLGARARRESGCSGRWDSGLRPVASKVSRRSQSGAAIGSPRAAARS